MKINKFNLEKKIEKSNIDVVSNFKYFIIAPLALMLVAVILLFTINFNKAIDYTGGYVAKVFIGEQFTYEQAQEKIEDILSENGLNASVYQQSEEDELNYIIVKYKKDNSLTDSQMSELNNQIVDDLFVEFGYDSTDMQQRNYVVGNQRIDASLGQLNLINVFSGVAVASALIVIYLLIRYGHQMAMTALTCVYHDLLIALSLTLITRVEINMTFISALASIFVYSFISKMLFFSKLKKNTEEVISKEKIANQTVKQNLKFEVLMTFTVLIMLILFSIIGTESILPFSIVTIFGVLATFYSTNFLSPTLWSFVFSPNKKKAKKIASKEIV